MSYSDVDGSDNNSEGSSHKDDDDEGDELGSDSTILDGSVSNRNEDYGSESDVGSSDSSVELDSDLQEINNRVEAKYCAACAAHELPKLKIRIAPLSSKRKQNESADEDKAEEAEPKTPIHKPKRKWSLIVPKEKLMKHSTIKLKRTVTKGKNKENALPFVKPPKCTHGRPHKVPVQESIDYAVPAYIKIIVPPLLVLRKSARGNKLKLQEPELVGPFHITPLLGWQEFLATLAEAAEVEKGSLLLDGEGLKWRFQSKNGKLPLKDENRYLTMKAQLVSHKDQNSAIIVITLPTNTYNSHRKAAQVASHDAIEAKVSCGQQDGTDTMGLWGQKLLHIEQLKEAYLIGNCDIHPGISCCKAPNGWHFDLSDSYRIKVFTNAILHKTTTAEQAPVGSQFFSAKDHLKDSLEHQTHHSVAPSTPQPHSAHHHPFAMMSSLWSPFGGFPNFPFPYGVPPLLHHQPPGYLTTPQLYLQQWGLSMPYSPGHQGPMSPVPGLASESHLVQSCMPPAGMPHTSVIDPIEEWGH